MRLISRFLFLLFILSLHFPVMDVHAAKPVRVGTETVTSINIEDPPKKNKLAVWSFILSGLGLLLIPVIGFASPYLFVGGTVCSIIALSQIKKTKQRGTGLAIAGLIIGGVSIIAIVLIVAVVLSIFA